MVSIPRRVRSLVLLLLSWWLGAVPAAAQAPSVVHAFDGVGAGTPAAGLTLGADGFLYGTTEAPAPHGAVFRVRTDGTGFSVLHVFAPGEGVMPSHGALARGAGGVFYGTTLRGGAGNRGTVYRLATGPFGATVTTLHDFAAADANPDGGVILASDGLLYGAFGDDATAATVYRLATDGTGFQHLRDLPNGLRPTGTLLEGSDGVLYGTTERGGFNDGGTVFRLNRDGTAFATLVELEGNPVAGLIEAPGPDGTPHLFGVETTGQNQVTQFGAIFQLQRNGADFLRLSGFTASDADGDTPRSPLLLGRDGALYGTATSERIGCPPENCGTVFRITPSGRPFSLFTFPQIAGGAPMGALVQGPDGTLYGTARVGGPDATAPGTGHGVVFAVPTPDRVPLALTGPALGDEGGEAAYTLTLRNTTNHTLAGPITVAVTPTPGLVFTDQSVDGWSCTQPQAAGLVCVWPTDLPAGVDSDAHTLRFTLAPPFSTNCGTGPSPCVSVLATVKDDGAAANALSVVRALAGGTLNSPPVPQDDTAPVYGTASAVIRVLDNDADPDGDALSVTRLLELPRFGDATINADGTITYTPVDTLVQPDTFRYEVSDGRVPSAATASAVVTLTPSVPTLTATKTRIDLGPLAPRRIATGRFYLRSPAAMEGRIELQPATAAEIATVLQGTAYDPAQAVSDPGAFRADPRFFVDPVSLYNGLVMVHYQAPPAVGRVSVAKVQLIGEPPGLAPVTRSVLIVASSADPATAPPRAVDDTTATPVQTEVWYDVLANDGGVSTNGRPLYVSSVGGVFEFPDNDVRVPANMSGYQTGPASITGPQEMAVGTRTTVTGTATVVYSVSELDACIGAPQPGDCQLEGNMYYGYLSVEVGGTPPDLSLALSPATSTVAPGDAVTLTATVTNQGPGMASRVTVSGFADLTRLTGLVVTPSQGTCAIPAPGGPLTCTLRNLVQGASATITFRGTAEATLIPAGQTSATLDVTASVSFGNADSQPGNNTAQARVTVTRSDPLPTIDFGPTVRLGCCEGTAPGPAGTIFVNLERQGDLSRESTVYYTLSAGPAPGASPDDIVGGFVSGSVTFAVDQVFAGVTINTTPDSLDEPDERVLLTLTSATGATLTRTSLWQAIFDDDLPRPAADVSVSLTATPQVVDVQQPVRIVAVVANGSLGEATNVTFSGLDAIVNTHSMDSVTPSQGTCEPVVAGAPVRCALGTLPVGSTATVEIVARPTSSVFQGPSQPAADVTVNALVGADEPDPSPTNNSASVVFQVRRLVADLSLTASLPDTQVTEGGTSTATLRVLNAGPDSADGTVQVLLPATSAVVNAAPGYDPATQTWTFGPVPSGGVATLDLTVRFDTPGSAAVGGEILRASQVDPDSTPGNGPAAGEDDAAAATLVVVARRPNLRAFKFALNEVGQQVSTVTTTEGARVVFQMGAVNTVTGGVGVGPTTGAVTLTDTLPTGLVFVSTASDPRCSAVGQVVTCVDGAVVPANGTVQFFVATSVQTGVAPGNTVSLYNAAVVSTPDDVIPDDNTSYAVTVTVTRPAEADLAVGVSSSAAQVETGQAIPITAVVTNNGPSAATGVVLRGFSDLTVFTSLSMTTTQGRCPVLIQIGPPAECVLGTLAAGASATITFTGTPTPALFTGSTGTVLPFTTSVSVSAAERDADATNNAGAAGFSVRRLLAPDLRITSATFENPGGGPLFDAPRIEDEVQLRVVVENVGDAVSGTARLSYNMPGLRVIYESPLCNSLSPCSRPDILPGGSLVLRVRVRVAYASFQAGQTTAELAGTVTVVHEAQSSFSGVARDPERNLANNALSTTLTVRDRRRPDLRIVSAEWQTSGRTSVTSARSGDYVYLRLLVENVGLARSGSMGVAANVPGLVSAGNDLSCSLPPCSWPALAPGAAQVLRARFRVGAAPAIGGQMVVSGTATVEAPSVGELDQANNSIAVSLTVLDRPRPDLRIASAQWQRGDGYRVTSARTGDAVYLALVVENIGLVRSGSMRLSVNVPGLVFLGNDLSCGLPPCAWPMLAPRASQVLRARFRVVATPAPGGQTVVSGTATVEAPSVHESDHTNNSIAVSLTVFDRRRPDVRLVSAGFYSTLSAGATLLTTARVGDEVELRALVENVTSVRSGSLNLSLDIPGLERLSQSPPCPGGVTSCSWPSLGGGESRSLAVRFRVTDVALAGQTTAVVAGPVTVRSSSAYVDGNWVGETNLANNSVPLALTVRRALNVFP